MIIYLEDDASMRRHSSDLLKEAGYVVSDFRRIDQVKEFFTNHVDEIECVITDLNMSDEWLGKYRNESDGGMISGWVWLQQFVYTVNPYMPTVIYSGYIPYLKDWLLAEGEEALQKLKKANIICVEKGDGEWEGFEGLKRTLQEKLHIKPSLKHN